MENERNNVNREYKDRLFKLVFREKEDLLNLYNAVGGTDYDNPEDAALDCHAEVLNINYGHNRAIMKKCRKSEEYSIFIGRVREKLNQKMSMKEAIDRAVDECIKAGILEKILRENREEDLLRAVDDTGYRNQLLKEYGL